MKKQLVMFALISIVSGLNADSAYTEIFLSEFYPTYTVKKGTNCDNFCDKIGDFNRSDQQNAIKDPSSKNYQCICTPPPERAASMY